MPRLAPQVKDRLERILLSKPNVLTRAIFWSIPHHSGREDVSLKIGRYTRVRQSGLISVECGNPRSELTLTDEESKALIDFIRECYEPFRHGTKAYIPLDAPYSDDTAEQIRSLFSRQDKQELVDFLTSNEIIPDEISGLLQHARRVHAVKEFRQMLADNSTEQEWQPWFQKNSWVLGSEFVRVLDDRDIDTQNISDFLMEAYDGFLDVVEIKRPEGNLRFWAASLDHGNYVPSVALTKAITQANRYVFEIEREANSIKFLERIGVRTVKPRVTLIFGRSDDWDNDQAEAYRILNAAFHNLSIMTYDHVLARAKRMVGLE